MESYQIDVVDNGAIVKVFLLEGAFPWNTPERILDSAGGFWESYALTHAALGFLVEESESEHVVEFYATNYVGAFLPDVTPPPPPPPPPPTPAPPTPAPATPAPATPAPTANATTAAPATPAPAATAAPVATPGPATAPPAFTPAPAPAGGNGTRTGTGTGTSMVDSFDYDARRGGGGGELLSPAAEGGEEEVVGYDRELFDDHDEEEAEGRIRTGVEKSDEGVGAGAGGRVGDGNGTTHVTWNNDAAIRITSGFDENNWISANYVAKITGLLYNDITGWSNTYLEKNPAYQPLSACSGSSDRGGGGEFVRNGSTDSYDFVWAAFERLAENGVFFDQEVVLKPKRTAMCLFPEGGVDAVELVEAAGNEEVGEYYRETGECVRNLAAAAAAGNSSYPGPACGSNGDGDGDGWAGEGGVSLMLGLGRCLDGHDNAYVYHDSDTYLRLPLTNNSNTASSSWSVPSAAAAAAAAAEESEAGRGGVAAMKAASGGGTENGGRRFGSVGVGGGTTARLVRYAPNLPPRPVQPPGSSDRAWIVYIAVGLAAFGMAAAGLRALFRRKQASLAYARGGGINSSGHGAGGGLFSSSAGSGWRSGGMSGSDFGDFDISGGNGYEGALFPADNYSSGGLSGSRFEVGPMEVPLLNQSDSPLKEARGRGGGGGRRQRQQQPLGRGAAATTSPPRRNRGGSRAGVEPAYAGGGGGGGGSDVSPPPFSRILGTMGGGPATAARRNRRTDTSGSGGGSGSGRNFSGGRWKGGGGATEGDDDTSLQQGPFGGSGGGGGGGGGSRSDRQGGALKGGDEPDGDEVFC